MYFQPPENHSLGAMPRKSPGLCFQLFTQGVVKPPLCIEVSLSTPRRHDREEKIYCNEIGNPWQNQIHSPTPHH